MLSLISYLTGCTSLHTAPCPGCLLRPPLISTITPDTHCASLSCPRTPPWCATTPIGPRASTRQELRPWTTGRCVASPILGECSAYSYGCVPATDTTYLPQRARSASSIADSATKKLRGHLRQCLCPSLTTLCNRVTSVRTSCQTH